MNIQVVLGRHVARRVSRFGLVATMALAAACAEEPDEPREGTFAADDTSSIAPPTEVRDGTWDETLAPGQSVAVEGSFLGNDPQSVCAYASTSRPRPRSGLDWAIRRDRRCMWVTGGVRIFGDPEAILDRSLVGRAVAITAIVRSDDTGRLMLEFVTGGASD